MVCCSPGEPSEGLADPEASREQGAAGDSRLATEVTRREQILDRRDATCGDHG